MEGETREEEARREEGRKGKQWEREGGEGAPKDATNGEYRNYLHGFALGPNVWYIHTQRGLLEHGVRSLLSQTKGLRSKLKLQKITQSREIKRFKPEPNKFLGNPSFEP